MPVPPASWSSAPPDLLAALAEAAETGTDDSTRYALDCIQLQGRRGQVVATDGRQLLVRSGFSFPWAEDLLIKARPVFGCRSLPREWNVEVGRTDTHVFVRAGAWTISCVIQRDVRFPAVERAIPEPAEVATRVRLHPEDAGFLETALGRLPGSDDINAPVTIDLNGHVAVRATSADQPGRVTELVLQRSGYTGDPMSVCTNRALLERALRLGFREIGFTGVESPVVCRTVDRVFAVQPLSGGSPPPADAEVIRIESIAAGGGERRVPAARETREASVTNVAPEQTQVAVEDGQRPPHRTTGTTPTTVADQPTSLAALLQEAESLHATLADARSRSARLIAGLRRQRKQSRLVNETLKSLRQLRLVENAG